MANETKLRPEGFEKMKIQKVAKLIVLMLTLAICATEPVKADKIFPPDTPTPDCRECERPQVVVLRRFVAG